MAPIRRYLRITKYSVLEVRIYLDNPALAQSWLLNPRNPVLPRVIDAVRPLVLPKLREERERARKRSTKKKGIKDIVIEDDFEVSIFLTETTTRHALLTKHKHFHDTTQTRLTSNSGRLVGASHEAPIDLDLEAASAPITLRQEEDDDDEIDISAALAAVPAAPPPAPAGEQQQQQQQRRRPKRARSSATGETGADEPRGAGDESDLEVLSSSYSSAVENNEEDEEDEDDGEFTADATVPRPPHKRRRVGAAAAAAATTAATEDDEMAGDDKKKLAMDISYEGFSIYGRVLCLVVKRREAGFPAGGASGRVASSGARGQGQGGRGGGGPSGGGGGQVMMENFIISTQLPAGTDV